MAPHKYSSFIGVRGYSGVSLNVGVDKAKSPLASPSGVGH